MNQSQDGAFGPVDVTIDFEVNGAGSDIDTIAFWSAPDPADSLMFVTSKNNNLKLAEVWKYPFRSPSDQLTPLQHSCIDQGSNGVEVDQEANLLYVSVRLSRNMCLFSLPDLTLVRTIISDVVYDIEPNLALLTLPDSSKRVYVGDRNIVYFYDADDGTKLGEFSPQQPSNTVEDLVGDDVHQILLIPDEHGGTGIYTHNPDGSVYLREGQDHFGDGGIIDADAEGILIYTCPSAGETDSGQGWVVVSDQITSSSVGNDYEVFDRETGGYLGHFKLKDSAGNYIYNTDGIGSIQQASSEYPLGVFVAVNSDTSVAGVGWDAIMAATGLSCGPILPTQTATSTATLLPTATSSSSSVPSPAPTQTNTPAPTATDSATPLPTATASQSSVPSATPTYTYTPAPTTTDTATPLPTATAIPTTVPSATSTPTSTPMPSDINVDGRVDVLDVQLCVNVFIGTETDPAIVARADVNSDEAVDVLDVQLIVNNYLNG